MLTCEIHHRQNICGLNRVDLKQIIVISESLVKNVVPGRASVGLDSLPLPVLEEGFV